jgi:hypothetical protein
VKWELTLNAVGVGPPVPAQFTRYKPDSLVLAPAEKAVGYTFLTEVPHRVGPTEAVFVVVSGFVTVIVPEYVFPDPVKQSGSDGPPTRTVNVVVPPGGIDTGLGVTLAEIGLANASGDNTNAVRAKRATADTLLFNCMSVTFSWR